MGFWDSLSNLFGPAEQVTQPTKPNVTGHGSSGRMHVGGFLDVDEINANLRGKEGIRAFDKMWRTDGDCKGALTKCVNPMVAADWQMEPYADKGEEATSEDEEIAEFCWEALTEHMNPSWDGHLWTALTVAGRAGFAPFEPIYELVKWRDREAWMIKTLDLRRPESVDQWIQAGPDLTGIRQFVTSKGATLIPASDLLYYRFGAEGDNWEGQSLLRPAYKHWKYKDAIELIDAMGHERTAIGVPIAYPPNDASPEALDQIDEFLENYRASESAYYRAPGPSAQYTKDGQGWTVEILTANKSEGASKGIKDSLDHHKSSIAAAVVQEFMRLGQSGEGARATADVQQDPFHQLCMTLAKIVVADAINTQLIPRLVGLNYSTDRLPKLKCALIDATSLTELADYVQKLTTTKHITPSPETEEFLREHGKLNQLEITSQSDPEEIRKAQEREMEVAQATKAPQVAPGSGKPAAGKDAAADTKKTLSRQPRELTAYESFMSLDRIESSIDGARARFELSCGEQVQALAQGLADQAMKSRVKHADPPPELVDALMLEMRSLYEVGRQTVREELDRQALGDLLGGFTLAAGDEPSWLRERALAAADAIRSGIVNALARWYVRRGVSDHAVLRREARTAGTAGLRAAATNNAAAVLNVGRQDQADQDADRIKGAYYTSVLDGNRCQVCKACDDDVLKALDDPERLANRPPNPLCSGADRCRCMEAYVLKAESAASA